MSENEEPSRTEIYAARQGLFDEAFTEILVKTWFGFERTTFEQLSRNDPKPVTESTRTLYVAYPEKAAEELIEDIECGYVELPEGTSLTWGDGSPLPVEPREEY